MASDHFRLFDDQITPRERGDLDASRGLELLDCPYSDAREIIEWQAGWRRRQAAKQEARGIMRKNKFLEFQEHR